MGLDCVPARQGATTALLRIIFGRLLLTWFWAAGAACALHSALEGHLPTPARPSVTLGPPPRCPPRFRTKPCQLLATTNLYRAVHQAPPLTWDVNLAAASQAYAESLVTQQCELTHGSVGENLYSVWRSSTAIGCGVALMTQAITFSSGNTYPGACKVVVCRYSPPGNYPDDGLVAANVLANITTIPPFAT
ncbi:hypothetical protein VOLCADRAFT_99452 [Volvox carteri f. nagariensis]|uniref:SCP domain-containing protein n=1 Tax=Volvox carteri f. nagariensis TaxID=3068 RepID=D8UHU4_VOLCA|nr:uncharacterized protein VOLCADRAFT_99452 [Volvox carteri f. nagariensis]EFJ40698.1 hypothetical protein VOLCADRAFT_99452 [Volvox carteri f. nagariensis]|eukprot:XP_002958244.1 hypothetical protein VOLCADRAFT_99452 [Volvox carteri f. nagariensis]